LKTMIATCEKNEVDLPWVSFIHTIPITTRGYF
jgi:hypothetical protein